MGVVFFLTVMSLMTHILFSFSTLHLGRIQVIMTVLCRGNLAIFLMSHFPPSLVSSYPATSTLKDIHRDIRDATAKPTFFTSLHSQTQTFIQYQCFNMLEKEVDKTNFAPVEGFGKKKKNRNIPYILL